MQKKLLVAAVAGALFAPAVMAQSTVTLSGSVRPSFDFVSASGTAGTNASKTTMTDNTSRFMLAGTEDLGGGLKAEFNVQVRFLVDTGVTASAQREIFAGLAGGWGAVRMGNLSNAFDDATLDGAAINPINGSGIHTPNQILGNYGSTALGTTLSADNRLPNGIKYLTPVFGGFQGSIHYVTSEGKTNAAATGTSGTDNSGWVIGGDYSAGPLRLILAHENLKNGTGIGGPTVAAINTAVGAPAVATSDIKVKGTRGTAMYNFGTFTIGGVLESLNINTAAGDIKRNAWEIGGLVEFGSSQVYANYTRAAKSKGITQAGAGIDDAANMIGIGYKYLLSKRSQVYVAYSKLDNKGAAAYTMGIAGYTHVLGNQDASALSIGMKHDF